ncbi:Imidazolonepropionase [Aquiflexum balticum DSM 16537]|uniref:Imidazolonepropionase n=1 Tax=Aquiflexum balticum DSM 16537 TaxID=758820 RepID=A0A1W2H5Z4_9BACT|nr:amidohydrolase family protein [Aquiflexum balticum]SMD44333.1 Imidazolonepropionase [Aquiflexum balticum DSM 16537]
MNIKLKVFSSLMFFGFFLSSIFAWSQSDPSGERRVTGTYAIKGATITTSPGKTVSGATIIIKNGLIEEVGTNVKIPVEAQVIEADSLFIYAGFIDGASNAGVAKPTDPERPSNFDPSNPPDEIAGITPWRNVLDNFDFKNGQVSDLRKSGFTVAQIIPDGGMLPGKSAIVVLGGNASTNIIGQNAALTAKLSISRGGRGMYPGTQLGIMAKFRDLYKNAEYSAQHKRLFAANSGLTRPEVNKTLEAFYPAIDKSIPIMFEVSNDLEIRRALSLQKENGFRLVLVGVTEADMVINEIKATNTQVLLSMKLPEDKITKAKIEDLSEEMKARTIRAQEAYKNSLKQAGLLEKAGIPFGFTSIDGKTSDLPKNLKLMIENGLSENAALAALTTNPANILGISKFAGTIEKGKLANMVIFNGPMFNEDSKIKHVIADGYIFDYEIKEKKASNGNGKNGTADIAGEWEYTSDTPAGSSGGTMIITKEGETLKGTITYDNPSGNGKASSEMKNISISGNYMTFSFDVAAGGMALVVSVSGDVDENKFSGNMSLADFGSFPLNASKKPNQSTR